MAAAAFDYGRHVGIAYQLVSDLQARARAALCRCVRERARERGVGGVQARAVLL